MDKYYVYEHLKPNTNEIFYVGKGAGHRANTKSNRNIYWHNIVNKYDGFDVRYLIKNVDEEFALLVECERISQLKMLNIKICNLTDGGDGVSGYKFTEQQRKNISDGHKGQVVSEKTRIAVSKAHKGIPKSAEVRKKISDSNLGKKRTKEQNEVMSKLKSKPVYCITEDKYFKSAKEASQHYGLGLASVSIVCNGKRNSVNKMKFCYVEDKKEMECP
jgi:hypothetical protein